ncbi:hypothetical protein [Pleurocapsa sp. CCALA 161]|nr:hypothetical protein [Pleurocapsa sp. CCALA 161]
MQNFHKVFNSVPIMSIVTLTMAMATLMFISFFLAIVPSGI